MSSNGKLIHNKQVDISLDRELQGIVDTVNGLLEKVATPGSSYPSDIGKQSVQMVNVGSNLFSLAVQTQDGYAYSLPGLFRKVTHIPDKGSDGKVLKVQADGNVIFSDVSLIGVVTDVTATAPVVSSEGTTPVISMAAATASVNGYLKSTDWTTFNNKQDAITPGALTKTDDTNVTLTLGGTPATSLLQAVSLTLGWTGTLADGRIASAATWSAKADYSFGANSFSGTGTIGSGAITSTGASQLGSLTLTSTLTLPNTNTIGGNTNSIYVSKGLHVGGTGDVPDNQLRVDGNAIVGANDAGRSTLGFSIATNTDNHLLSAPNDATRTLNVENSNATVNAFASISMRVDATGAGTWYDIMYKKTGSAAGTAIHRVQTTNVLSLLSDGSAVFGGQLTIGSLAGLLLGTAGVVSAVTATTSADYVGGDFAVHTLNQASVAGLTTADSPTFVTVKCSGLTDTYIPKHTSDAVGLENSALLDDTNMLAATNRGLLLSGTTGTIPATGAGTRLMWYPAKGAFRAGVVASTYWDDANIGISSIALGNDVTASGQYSVALGNDALASGLNALAANSSEASGDNSTAFSGSTAVGLYSIACGSLSVAEGSYSVAIGYLARTNADYAITIGNSYNTIPSSILLGYKTTIDGTLTLEDYTTAGILHNAVTTGLVSSSLIVTADITAKNVTYACIQDITATSRVLGRITAGAGVTEELTAANLKTMCSYYTSGDSPTFVVTTTTTIRGNALEIPHLIKKAASANVRNSHDAEATDASTSYIKKKTITLTNGLVGQARFLFDIKTETGGGETAYGKIYRNGVALGTEQTSTTDSYATKSEDITQTWNPGDTCELWIKNNDGTLLTYVQNFRIAYDDSATIAVLSANS